jgi:two-component system, cell cycle sensor histidine kinase and response regulator CckA
MNTYKVLIAEDEGLIAMDIAAHLEALGHTVVGTVSTAAEAIEQAPNAQVVLMDIRLDGPVDGIEAASKIRERYRLPVVFLTAQADPSTLERAKLAAPFGYILKPLAHAALQPSIEIAMYKHQMEARLEESEAWMRATLASAADAVIVTDAQGQIRFLNPAAEALVARDVTEVSQILAEDPLPLAILRDAPVPIRAQLAEQWVEGYATPLKASGAVIGGVLTLRDVTARRREEQRMRQVEKADTAARLAAGVADDFASLVAVIRKHSDQLLRQFVDYTPVHAAIEEIQQAASAAEKITRRLTDLSARPPGNLEVLNLNAIVRRMAKFLQSIAGAQIAVSIRPAGCVGRIFANTAHTEELITKMVLHAVKSLAGGGQLIIETSAAGDNASLSVTPIGVLTDFESVDLCLMRYLAPDGSHLEAFFLEWSEPEPAAAEPPTLLLIEPRERIRARLHNVFEARGYNLLEADDDVQADTLLDLHEVDLVIGGTAERDALQVLRLPPTYTEQEILEQVRARLDPPLTFSAAS